MRRYIFVGFLFVICSLSYLFSNSIDNNLLWLAKEYKSSVQFYVSTMQEIKNCPSIQNGNSKIIKCDYKNANSVFNEIKDVVGISIQFEGGRKEFLEICERLNLKIISQENINSSINSYLGYTNKFANIISIDNKKVNVQIARNKNIITVGTPIILGSY